MVSGKPHNIWIFLLAIVIPNIGGWIGIAIQQDRSWFENTVQHPPWRPPNWLFPIAWTIVYSTMGIASYYVWRHGQGIQRLLALCVFVVQLIVNWFWTPFFFVWKLILVSLIDMVVMWILVVITICLFWRIKRTAAFFFFPCITWITIALALNSHYYYLNKNL